MNCRSCVFEGRWVENEVLSLGCRWGCGGLLEMRLYVGCSWYVVACEGTPVPRQSRGTGSGGPPAVTQLPRTCWCHMITPDPRR